MSANRLTTEATGSAWLVHDGPGGRVYDLFEKEADAREALAFHDRPGVRAEIKRLPLNVVISDAEWDKGRQGAQRLKVSRPKRSKRWKAYLALSSVLLAAAIASLFFDIASAAYAVSHGVAYLAALSLVVFVMSAPSEYPPVVVKETP